MSGVGAMQPRDYVTELNLYHQRILTPSNGACADNSRANTYECLSDRPPFSWRCWYKPCAESEDYCVTVTGAISDRKAQVKQVAAAQALQHIADVRRGTGGVSAPAAVPATAAAAAAAADSVDILTDADSSASNSCCSSDDGDDFGADTPPVPRRPPAQANVKRAQLPKRSAWCYYDPFAIAKLARRHIDNGGGQGAWHFCPKPIYEVDQQTRSDGLLSYSVCVRWLHRGATGDHRDVDMERVTVDNVATLDVACFMAAEAALMKK